MSQNAATETLIKTRDKLILEKEQSIATYNSRKIYGKSDKEIVNELVIFMSVLEPKNRETFSKWGFPKDQSNITDCWE